MRDKKLYNYFKPGDILAYYNDKNNAAHHTTWFGKLIEYTQWGFWWGTGPLDTRVTHVSLIDKTHPRRPEPGFTPLKIFDILKGKQVSRRTVEHNFAVEVFRLRSDREIHPEFTADQLAQKALVVARQCVGLPYNSWTAFQVFWDWSNREGAAHGRVYTAWLAKRFQIDPQHKTFRVDKDQDSLISAELVMLSYQIAWLLLAGEQALTEPLPDWLNFHAHCTPAGLTHFLSENPYFEKVSPEHIESLRYSGTPDPRDLQSPTYVQRLQMVRGYWRSWSEVDEEQGPVQATSLRP